MPVFHHSNSFQMTTSESMWAVLLVWKDETWEAGIIEVLGGHQQHGSLRRLGAVFRTGTHSGTLTEYSLPLTTLLCRRSVAKGALHTEYSVYLLPVNFAGPLLGNCSSGSNFSVPVNRLASLNSAILE
jgi:hypothetical protein